ncbi:uncharacterized protein OCT59_027664 [Rhizophagus irregularis]|uniref:uncharacterized protein n=1 Tax=Rhizophagus irregularis TaxID=588596 RepID=UPI00331A4157|nr:hypothetical protein OCT59_027664 [Rhizophagus irregularis]
MSILIYCPTIRLFDIGGYNNATLSYDPKTLKVHENRLIITLNEVYIYDIINDSWNTDCGRGCDKSVESDILLLDISNNEEYIWITIFDPPDSNVIIPPSSSSNSSLTSSSHHYLHHYLHQ